MVNIKLVRWSCWLSGGKECCSQPENGRPGLATGVPEWEMRRSPDKLTSQGVDNCILRYLFVKTSQNSTIGLLV